MIFLFPFISIISIIFIIIAIITHLLSLQSKVQERLTPTSFSSIKTHINFCMKGSPNFLENSLYRRIELVKTLFWEWILLLCDQLNTCYSSLINKLLPLLWVYKTNSTVAHQVLSYIYIYLRRQKKYPLYCISSRFPAKNQTPVALHVYWFLPSFFCRKSGNQEIPRFCFDHTVKSPRCIFLLFSGGQLAPLPQANEDLVWEVFSVRGKKKWAQVEDNSMTCLLVGGFNPFEKN